MTNQSDIQQLKRIEQRFEQQLGLDLLALLKPITELQPSGTFLKGSSVYTAIKEARVADDPNLPMGEWQHNLKVADWDSVIQIALDALLNQSKDIQIGIWLLEAQMHKFSFAGIAPGVMLLKELCEKFWVDIYPQIEDGDLDYRTNLIAWLNDKLQPGVRQLAITNSRSETQYTWSDWEIALQFEQLPEKDQKQAKHVSLQQISQGINATPIEFYRDIYQYISDALFLLEQFSHLLDEKCAENAPSVHGLSTLLLEIRETLAAQVQHRGLFMTTPQEQDIEQPTPVDSAIFSAPAGPIATRAAAYAQLADAAEFLLREDPHSPVPYLVIKAIEWGNLNTAELYQELFVKYQGQLNIFEILGLEIKQ